MSDIFTNIRGGEALEKLLTLPINGPILDIGSGTGLHAAIMRQGGLSVTTLDSHHAADVLGVWPEVDMAPEFFGAVWACHVLEHSRNPGAFLDACWDVLKPGGLIVVTVPPAKHNIVGGHVSIWNAGLLLYHLILAGFDCRRAQVKRYGYNISIIARKGTRDLPPLVCDEGDINTLAHLFPCRAAQGFDGDIQEIGWEGDDNG